MACTTDNLKFLPLSFVTSLVSKDQDDMGQRYIICMHTKKGHNIKKHYRTSAWEHTGNETSTAIANVSFDRACTMG